MAKTQVVIFTQNNTRILINPPNVEELRKLDNVLVDPDLTQVKGVPLEFWKCVKDQNQAIPMNRAERAIREAHLALVQAKNDTSKEVARAKRAKLIKLILIGAVTAVAIIIGGYLHSKGIFTK